MGSLSPVECTTRPWEGPPCPSQPPPLMLLLPLAGSPRAILHVGRPPHILPSPPISVGLSSLLPGTMSSWLLASHVLFQGLGISLSSDLHSGQYGIILPLFGSYPLHLTALPWLELNSR